MKKTLQDQYLLIKEGKGHKGVFLTEAKRQFPNIIRNAATFEEAVSSLKTKNIISENIVGLTAVAGFEPRKKETYETAFEKFLAEAKKKENEDEKVKAEEKKVSKPVEEDLEKQYDKTDDKNPDNLIFDQIMMGYYTEMKDPKNADKTMQQLKDIVLKNLAKDPIYYTKDGQFGVKGLGYVTEHPGLGEPKEPKGKYKSSGYGDLKESIGRNYPGELEGEYEGELQKIYGADIYDTLKDVLDISNSEDDFIRKMTMSLTDETNILPKSSEEKLRTWYQKNSSGLGENLDKFKSDVRKGFTQSSKEKPSDEDIKAKLKQKREAELKRRKEAGESLEEITLRKVIREIIDAELEEAYQLKNINIKSPKKDREEREPSDKYLTFDKDFEKVERRKENLIVKDDNTIFITKVLHANLGPKAGNSELRKYLMDRTNLEPAVLGGKPVWKIKGAKINSKGNVSVFVPVEKKSEGSLMESVEKDLADINKEAEHEILQSKLDKIDVLIDKRKSQLGKLDEDEDMKALTDKKKVKELEKDIKKLEQAKSKVEKMISKSKGKKATSKEVIDEVENEPSEEYLQYKEDAESRYEEGQDIDSILNGYNNIPLDMKNMLRNDLEAKFEGTDNE